MANFPPVLILAGGLGTRVSSLYPDLPKAMIPVNDEPFIGHQLKLLARENVTDVILCLGHLSETIVEYVGNGEAFGLNVQYSYDGEKLLGTGGAILKASLGLNRPFAVLYGDSYLDTNFYPIYDAFQQADKLGVLAVFENKNQMIPSNLSYKFGMVVHYDKNKPSPNMQYVDYGLSIFKPQAFSAFADKQSFDLAEVFTALIKEKQLAAYEVKDRFYEAGSEQGINELAAYIKIKNK